MKLVKLKLGLELLPKFLHTSRLSGHAVAKLPVCKQKNKPTNMNKHILPTVQFSTLILNPEVTGIPLFVVFVDSTCRQLNAQSAQEMFQRVPLARVFYLHSRSHLIYVSKILQVSRLRVSGRSSSCGDLFKSVDQC